MGCGVILGASVGIYAATMNVRRQSDRREDIVVAKDIVLGDRELKVENVQELALNATNVALAEHAGAERPVDVFESGVVEIL